MVFKELNKNRKIFLFFSNVIDTQIYRALLLKFSSNQYDLHCVFIGHETEPLFKYSSALPIHSKWIPKADRLHILALIVLNIFRLGIARPRAVICFGQTASMVGLTASYISCNAMRIYLRMHTSMNKIEGYSRGVLYDKVSNFLAQKIIVPNQNTGNYLEENEKVNRRKLNEIRFGIDLNDFREPGPDRIRAFRKTYDLPDNGFIIGIASRFTHMKGFQYSLPALTSFMKKNPQSVLILAGSGKSVVPELEEAIRDIPQTQLRIIPRVNDMAAFYNSLSIFMHTPIDETVESFGLVYIEAFAAGVPAIITVSGIAKEIAINAINCVVVDFKNSEAIEKALDYCANNQLELISISENAQSSVSSFSVNNMCDEYIALIG